MAERLAQRVERAGADIAVNDTDRREGERAQVAVPVSRACLGIPDRRGCRQGCNPFTAPEWTISNTRSDGQCRGRPRNC